MKKLIIASILYLLAMGCNAQNKIEVWYLTANAYCPSVEQIESAAKGVLDSLFTKQIEDGIIEIHKLNIMLEENQAFDHKWDISTNGLMLLVYNQDKGTKVDLNELAFSNVPSDIPYFKEAFAKVLREQLEKIQSK